MSKKFFQRLKTWLLSFWKKSDLKLLEPEKKLEKKPHSAYRLLAEQEQPEIKLKDVDVPDDSKEYQGHDNAKFLKLVSNVKKQIKQAHMKGLHYPYQPNYPWRHWNRKDWDDYEG